MKIIFVLSMLALLSFGSAETIQFGNYTATFDMTQPHIIDHNITRTFYGNVWFENISTQNTTILFLGAISDKNAGLFMMEDRTYLILLSNIPEFGIKSTMNLTSTLDFLKSLKIEKTKSA